MCLGFVLVALFACGARQPRVSVNHLRIYGTERVGDGDLRERIATQEMPRLIGIPWPPWGRRPAFDLTTFRRDLERIERYYRTRGYYSATVEAVRITPNSDGSIVDLDVALREGPATRVGTVWLSGCENPGPGYGTVNLVPADVCGRLRGALALQPGQVFDESVFDSDRGRLSELLAEEGYAGNRVHARALIDPTTHLASVLFVVEPGPRAIFDEVRVYEPDPCASAEHVRRSGLALQHLCAERRAQDARRRDAEAATGCTTQQREGEADAEPGEVRVTGNRFAAGYDARPVFDALHIRRGERYRRGALAQTQRTLFDFGVFGFVRFSETPLFCDSQGRCGLCRDQTDPEQTVRVVVKLHLSFSNASRWRLGGGAETDQVRSNFHFAATYEHRNVRVLPLRGYGRFRFEFRPTLYLPPIQAIWDQNLQVPASQIARPGGSVTAEYRQIEIGRGATGFFTLGGEFGPDPVNPVRTNRVRATQALGVQTHLLSTIGFSAALRTTEVFFYGQDQFAQADPIYNEQYLSQVFPYLEAAFNYDSRDSGIQPHRGVYLSGVLQGGIAGPIADSAHPDVFGINVFGRGTLEGRFYVPFGRQVTLAVRTFFGIAGGTSNSSNPWPVPQELRFYSGGANSNRGYPFGRVGYVATVPRQTCGLANSTSRTEANCNQSGLQEPFEVVRGRSTDNPQPRPSAINQALPDETRAVAVGGLLGWEFSTELRWFPSSFGVVAFLDLSDVMGWRPPNLADIPRRYPGDASLGGDRPPATPRPSLALAGQTPDAHPSVGLGIRYLTPVGVLRVDVGMRADDILCTRYYQDIDRANNATAGLVSPTNSAPAYFVTSRPRCDFLGLAVPLSLQFAIGEAF